MPTLMNVPAESDEDSNPPSQGTIQEGELPPITPHQQSQASEWSYEEGSDVGGSQHTNNASLPTPNNLLDSFGCLAEVSIAKLESFIDHLFVVSLDYFKKGQRLGR